MKILAHIMSLVIYLFYHNLLRVTVRRLCFEKLIVVWFGFILVGFVLVGFILVSFVIVCFVSAGLEGSIFVGLDFF